MHTDIFFRFWKDLFAKEEEVEDISEFMEKQAEKEKEMDKEEKVDIRVE